MSREKLVKGGFLFSTPKNTVWGYFYKRFRQWKSRLCYSTSTPTQRTFQWTPHNQRAPLCALNGWEMKKCCFFIVGAWMSLMTDVSGKRAWEDVMCTLRQQYLWRVVSYSCRINSTHMSIDCWFSASSNIGQQFGSGSAVKTLILRQTNGVGRCRGQEKSSLNSYKMWSCEIGDQVKAAKKQKTKQPVNPSGPWCLKVNSQIWFIRR